MPGTVWLDAARVDPDSGTSAGLLFRDPVRVLLAHTPEAVSEVLLEIDAAIDAGYVVAGALAYEAGAALEPAVGPVRRGGGWLAAFGVYGRAESVAPEQAETWLDAAAPGAVDVEGPRVSVAEYLRGVRHVRRAIREGDVYQVNVTLPVGIRLTGDPLGVYRTLRRRQPTAFSAVLTLAGRRVLSLSPELFFRIDARGARRLITTRPMKGTTRRGASAADDDRLAEGLRADPKNRAENLMIVDLLRNDLSRVARPRSVRVSDLFTVEQHPTLQQMTSTVQGRLRQEVSFSEVLRALFPCGSVTGAPKIRAMQIIREVEPYPRGVYCGAIGWAGPNGVALNVPIRTLALDVKTGGGTLGIGSGIVWDSEPGAEYEESLLKAHFLTDLAASGDE